MHFNDKNEKFRELCYIGDLELVRKYFESKKPDINSQNKVNGWTALHWAAKQNHVDLVRFLLDKGASKSILTNDGKLAANLSTDQTIRSILDSDHYQLALYSPKQTDFVPSFKKYPEFHYINENLYDSAAVTTTKSIEIDDKVKPPPHKSILIATTAQENNENLHDSAATTRKSIEIDDKVKSPLHKSILVATTAQENNSVTIKIRTNLDEDFVEIDLNETASLRLDEFQHICEKEFDYVSIDFNVMKLHKIRKLPNVLIRNSADIKRLRNGDAVEFSYVNKQNMNLI